MFSIFIIGGVLVTLNVGLQAVCNVWWIKMLHSFMKNKTSLSWGQSLQLLIGSFLLFTLLHLLQTIIWALGYFWIPAIKIQFANFTESVYFSIVTFTTLGYGDVTLHSEGRILSGLEAINGIMLLGWTTAIMFSLIQHIFHKMNGGK